MCLHKSWLNLCLFERDIIKRSEECHEAQHFVERVALQEWRPTSIYSKHVYLNAVYHLFLCSQLNIRTKIFLSDKIAEFRKQDFHICVFIYFRLFEEHKELLSLFTKFHQLTTRDEQANSEELAEHASSVMSTLDESIRSLDNVDTFLLYLHQVGQSHYKIEGFQKEYFWVSPFMFVWLYRTFWRAQLF